MTYYSGSVGAVPSANKQKYIDHLAEAWAVLKGHGAIRMVEAWGADVPPGKQTDFYRAVAAREDETVVFSWIEWADRATADAAWRKMMDDPAMQAMAEMPFDGSRMIFGGFTPVYEGGKMDGAGYYQGFVLAVPEGNRAAYVKMADEGWKMFQKAGATGMIETWGQDVPRGKVTDFYRATMAEPDETIVFSWTGWPDRATCDAAARAMEAEMPEIDPSAMPFDGKRMFWAGFEPIFDSNAGP